ncbi:MAG: anti-sigma factor family protein [Gammaproteobacteria bacterium]
MSISEETLMAYADGEVDEATRRAVEQAIRRDPALAAKVRRHQTLRGDVFAALAPAMDEPVPQRLRSALRSPKVIHLDAVRAARNPPPEPVKPKWAWREWGAIAASLVVGIGAGALALRGTQDVPQLALNGGVLRAQGTLASALNTQLASAAPRNAAVHVGLSFVSKDGVYCRSFVLPKESGLACRSNGGWSVPVLAEGGSDGTGTYRQAGNGLPDAVLDAIDTRIAGKALDIAAEQAARDRGWKR